MIFAYYIAGCSIVWIYIYVCTCTCTYIHVHMYLYTYMHIYICMYIYIGIKPFKINRNHVSRFKLHYKKSFFTPPMEYFRNLFYGVKQAYYRHYSSRRRSFQLNNYYLKINNNYGHHRELVLITIIATFLWWPTAAKIHLRKKSKGTRENFGEFCFEWHRFQFDLTNIKEIVEF